MYAAKLNNLRELVKANRPLIHCITNPISINACSNAALAVGARPMMAEHPKEAAEITATAQALVLNLGNITDVRMQAMPLAAAAAEQARIPVVLDLVGIAGSKLRRRFAASLLQDYRLTAIKGNYSEIYALYREEYRSPGVDADGSLATEAVQSAAAALAKKYNTLVLASGKVDLVTDGKRLIHIKNGTPQLAAVTGTGCMLGVLCGCYLSVCREIDALAAACAVLGICGELAETASGSGSFFTGLMDKLSVLTEAELENHIKLEEKTIENL